MEGGDKWTQNMVWWKSQQDLFKGLHVKNGRKIKIKEHDMDFSQSN